VLFIINAFLYPYSRFVYERIADFIMGDNVLYGNAFIMMLTKLFLMSMCWSFSPIIAPIGLVWLYFHHTSAMQKETLPAQENGLD
jgi:hypothetical protein